MGLTKIISFNVIVLALIFQVGSTEKHQCGIILEKPTSKNGDEGFVPLFNGRDFQNWVLLLRDGTASEAQKVFTIDDGGILHFFRDLPKDAGSKTRINAFHGVMVTKKSYNRYHLKFEFKWGDKLVNNYREFQYDAGVFYQIDVVKVFPIGLQYQIRYNHLEDSNHVGDFWAAGVQMQWYSEDGKTFKLPSDGGVKQPFKMGEHQALADARSHGLNGEWNSCEIVVMDNKYAIHKLNGQIVNLATDLGSSEGPIALEAETGEILWRNIEIKEYEEPVPMERFLKE